MFYHAQAPKQQYLVLPNSLEEKPEEVFGIPLNRVMHRGHEVKFVLRNLIEA